MSSVFDTFAQKNNFRCQSKFTTSFSKTYVGLLATRIKFSRNCLINELFYKPTSSYIYLQLCSDHRYTMIKTNSNWQFLRMRRIWIEMKDYWKHASNFIWHYVKASYQESRLIQIANKIANDEYYHNFILRENTEKQ